MNKLTYHNGHWGVGQHLNLQYFILLKTIQKFLQAVHCTMVGKGEGREKRIQEANNDSVVPDLWSLSPHCV